MYTVSSLARHTDYHRVRNIDWATQCNCLQAKFTAVNAVEMSTLLPVLQCCVLCRTLHHTSIALLSIFFPKVHQVHHRSYLVPPPCRSQSQKYRSAFAHTGCPFAKPLLPSDVSVEALRSTPRSRPRLWWIGTGREPRTKTPHII